MINHYFVWRILGRASGTLIVPEETHYSTEESVLNYSHTGENSFNTEWEAEMRLIAWLEEYPDMQDREYVLLKVYKKVKTSGEKEKGRDSV